MRVCRISSRNCEMVSSWALVGGFNLWPSKRDSSQQTKRSKGLAAELVNPKEKGQSPA